VSKTGGLGLGYLEHMIAIEEVSAPPPLSAVLWAHSNLCINQIERLGSTEQKAEISAPNWSTGENISVSLA